MRDEENEIRDRKIKEELKLAESILNKHITNKNYITEIFGEDEFNRMLYFNRGKVEVLKDKLVGINKKD